MQNLSAKFMEIYEKRCDECPAFFNYQDYDDWYCGCVIHGTDYDQIICKLAFVPKWVIALYLKIRDWKIERQIMKDEQEQNETCGGCVCCDCMENTYHLGHCNPCMDCKESIKVCTADKEDLRT